jgi:hypothetical protein
MYSLIFLNDSATVGPAVVDDGIDVGPVVEFTLPIAKGGEWHNDQEWAMDADIVEGLEEDDCLKMWFC